MKKPDTYDQNGIPIFTIENVFRPGENVYIHLSADLPEYVGVLHKHEFIEIVYVLSGRAVHKNADVTYEVSRGDVVVIDYNTPHVFCEQQGDEKFLAYDLMFTPGFLDPSLIHANDFNDIFMSFLFYSLFPGQRRNAGPDLHLSGSNYSLFGELFHKIYLEFTDKQKGYQDLIRVYVIELLIKLFRIMDAADSNRISSRQEQLVGAAVAYLRENYHRHISLDELAVNTFLSKDYLNRIFRKTVGMPVNTFLQNLRVEAACQLLTTTDQPVTDIAADCGFGDTKFFYVVFKRLMHMTPGEYRTQKKE